MKDYLNKRSKLLDEFFEYKQGGWQWNLMLRR
jgi:hypothetical protein